MVGRVAVAPAGEEAFGGLWPGSFGGNMDASDIREGATVFLPVYHDGALFYFGDIHAAQGDGEVCGSGLETTAVVTMQFELIKGKKILWPRIEDADHIMVAGSGRPLIDAFRIAHVELIEWLVADYGFEKMEAYQVVSQVGSARVANVVDPLYTVVAKFPKALLPKKSVFEGTTETLKTAPSRPAGCLACRRIRSIASLRLFPSRSRPSFSSATRTTSR